MDQISTALVPVRESRSLLVPRENLDGSGAVPKRGWNRMTWVWMAAAALAILAAAVGSVWLGFAALLPLLYTLPCLLMLGVCMKNMGGTGSGSGPAQ